MSIETMTAKAGPFDCDGVQTEFPFAFDPLDSSYLTVYVNADIVSSGYTTTLNASGGTVTFSTPPESGARVAILRNVPPTQLVDLQNNTAFLPEVIEGMGDKLTAIAQQIMEVEERAFVVPPTADGTAKDEIERMISSGGGGGGGGGSSYEFSNEFTVTSGGSVSVNKIDKSKITGLSSALDEKQDKLVSGNTYHINVDSADSATKAGYAPYTGPFALSGSSTPYGFYYNINGGDVYFGGSSYSISSSTGGSTPLPSGSAIYLHFYSSTGGYDYEYVTSAPSSATEGHYYTRIGENSGGKAVQFQYGDIRLQEPSSGGGTVVIGGATTMAWDTNYTAPSDGLILANAAMTTATVVGGAGSYAAVVVGDTTYKFAQTPQAGIESGAVYGCSLQVPVASGQVWSAAALNNSSDCHLYFMAFNTGS